MKFTYGSGQRPLEGYTIKRGIGRGGFGEVYYGLSDGGKEVALKLVRGNQEVELRGMSQCLNFKHPNLVNLFDLRTDPQGDHWVVMEYIGGEPLNVILSRHPNGLDPELARRWFLGLAAAVGYLHDHGIVHRDLKPGNIFLENGTVKVGDYGLSKFMSSSRGSAQTQSVGTVHYMAPEISTGNYNKQIDIYAAGIILYEMLTGRVPFDGESAGEILMKHLTSAPDLTKVPAEFRPVVERALCKNPAQRFSSMAEMARLVEALGVEEVPDAKLMPRPAVARVVRETPPLGVPEPPAPPRAPLTVRAQVAELCGSMALAAVVAGLLSILWMALAKTSDWTEIGACYFLTVSCSWAVLAAAKLWPRPEEDSWGRRAAMMILGLAVGLEAAWLDGRTWPGLLARESPDLAEAEEAAVWNGATVQFGQNGADVGPGKPVPSVLSRFFGRQNPIPALACYLSYFGLAFFAVRWWRMADRVRAQRFSLFPVLAAGFWAYLLVFLFWPHPKPAYGVVALFMTSVIVQLVSPWEEPPPPRSKRLRLRYV